MPRQPTRVRSGVAVELKPIGGGGLNLDSDPVMLRPDEMAWARNADATKGTYGRRLGPAKIATIEDDRDDRGAKQFATIAKFASFAPPLMPAGSWVFLFHFTAVRHATDDGYILDSIQSSGPTRRVLRLYLTAAGVLTVGATWTTGTEDTITTSALTANSTQHGMLVFDAAAGTLTLYLNGAVAGTPVSGLDATKQLWQTTTLSWFIGVSSSSGGVKSLPFQGYIDGLTFISYAGVDLTDEDLTLLPPRKSILNSLLERSKQDWPVPTHPGLVFQYGLDEDTTLTSTMYDASNAARNGTYAGSPANAPRVAVRSQNGNWLGTTRRATVAGTDDARVNVAIVGGQTMIQTLLPGS